MAKRASSDLPAKLWDLAAEGKASVDALLAKLREPGSSKYA